jgi:hypothetical protein
MEIRPEVKSFFDICQQKLPQELPGESVITVSAATRRIAFAYERFRNTLEPDEEDVLRRKAIARILERRLEEDRPVDTTATVLLQELLRGRYIQRVTAEVLQATIREITQVRSLEAHLDSSLRAWFLRLAAVSIDRELYPRQREEALIHLLYRDAYQRTVWMDDFIAEDERASQLYVACHRALFASTDDEITYHYWLRFVPSWKSQVLSATEVEAVLKNLPNFYQKMQTIIHYPYRQRLMHLLRAPAVPYRMMRDTFREHTATIFTSPETLSAAIREAIQRRENRLYDRMQRRSWHSVLFLLLTKTIIALIVELPYEYFLVGTVYWMPITINTFFHPVLLFLLGTTARLPGERNRQAIIDQIQAIVSGGETASIVLNAPRRYGALTWSLFAIFYAILFMVIFWALFSILDLLNFSLIGIVLFVIFLGLVSFLAIRVRRSADQIRVLVERESTLGTMISFVALPVLEFGSWLTRNISQVNVLLFLMDRVLEAPFKLFIDVVEEWFVFVRDRREEIL